MPSPTSSRRGSQQIDKLDFDVQRQRKPSATSSQAPESRQLLSPDHDILTEVVAGAVDLDKQALSQKVYKTVSFTCALLCSLCAGSITAFSLYAPLLILHLKYSQYRINALSTVAELGCYLPVPLVGWFCDRYSPRWLSGLSALIFGLGYSLAAAVYRAGPTVKEVEMHNGTISEKYIQHGWPFEVMLLAFAMIGCGTVSMYMSAVTACAKNFGRGKHKGVALGAPIACFGLSGMWQTQVGSHLFKEEATGELDVFRYFVFLASLLFVVGVIGSLGLRIVDEDALIEEAAEDLERSGLLPPPPILPEGSNNNPNYGTVAVPSSPSLDKSKSTRNLRTRLLNQETIMFLQDPTMWLLTLGFFLISGPGETYLNNVGTLLHTAYPPPSTIPSSSSPATHVSLIAITSTIGRLLTGTVSDFLSPATSSSEPVCSRRGTLRCSVPRVVWLLISALLYSISQLLVSTPLPDKHPSAFAVSSCLQGLGYGAIFSLVPIIVSVVWGVENFGTNWGLVAVVPAPGAALWGVIYSTVYEGTGKRLGYESGKCYGSECYRATFIAMTLASWITVVVWIWAWRGWKRRGVVV